MSATHDSVIKTGTHRPGTLRFVFPHVAVARASRRFSQPRRARPRYTGALSSPAASSRVPRMLRHPRVSRQNATRASTGAPAASHEVRRHGAAPRWSRPASSCRVNDTDPSMARSIFCFRRVSIPYVRGALGARASRYETGSAQGSERRQKLYSVLLSTGPGCIHRFGPDPEVGVRSLVRGSPDGGWRGPRYAARRGAGLRCRRSSTFAPRPRAPLPDTFVTAPGSSRVGPPTSFRRGRGVHGAGPFPPGAFPHRHGPDRGRARAVHRERCAKCLCDRAVGDP
jgi:hypothetical protein